MRKKVILPIFMALLIALSTIGVGLAFADTTDPAPTTLATEKLVSVTGATVTPETDKVYGTNTTHHTGLFVDKTEGNDTYSGNIKGVFGQDNSETELKYTFWGSAYNKGSVTYRITDVADSSNYIEIEHYQNTYYPGVALIDRRNGKNEIRITACWNEGAYVLNSKGSADVTMGHWFGPNGNTDLQGLIKLSWEEDVLIITVTGQQKGTKVLAKFDGTAAIEQGTSVATSKFGLDKISFPKGYTISFESKKSSDVTVPILFESIKSGNDTVSLASATLDTVPSWYTAYQSVTEIAVDDYQFGSYVAGDKVPTATYNRPAIENFEATAVEKTYIKKEVGEYTELAADATFPEGGSYTVKYVAVDGADYIGNEFEKTFTVLAEGEYYEGVDLVSTTANTKKFENFDGVGVINRGVATYNAENQKPFDININGIFNGTSKIGFQVFGSRKQNENNAWVEIDYKIINAEDPNDYIAIEYRHMGSGDWYTNATVKYKGVEKTSSSFTQFGFCDKPDQFVKFEAGAEGAFTLKGNKINGSNVATESVLGTFDGADGNFAKPTFTKGYRISMRIGDNTSVPVVVTSVENGTAASNLKNKYVSNANLDWYEAYKNVTEIAVNDYQFGSYAAGDKVPTATYIRPALGADETAVEKIFISKDGGAETELEADATFPEGGNYTVKYVAVDGADFIGNEVIKTFTVLSEGEYYKASDLITTDGKVKDIADESGTVSHRGVLIEPKIEEENQIAFGGNINGVFEGNSRFKFHFPGLRASDRTLTGSVTFTFTDAVNPANSFEVLFRYASETVEGDFRPYYVIMSVRHKGTVRTTKQWAETPGYILSSESAFLGYLTFFGANNDASTEIELLWEDDVLVVKGYGNYNKSGRIIAKFDGSTAINDSTTDPKWGLPKIAFNDGYIVSFKSEANRNRVSPIMFESINGVDVSTKYITETTYPEFYKTYQDIVNISLDSEPANTGVTVKPFVIPSATYVFPAKTDAAKAVAKIELSKDGGEFAEIQAGEKTLEKGRYTVRYTAVANGENIGNTAERSFEIFDEYYEYKNIVTNVTGATVTAGANASGTVTHRGVLISPAEELGSYEGEFNGVFTGDSKFTFNFPGTLRSGGYSRGIDFTFRFEDVSDPINYFEIFFFNDGWGGYYTSAAVRDRRGEIRASLPNGTVFNKTTSGNDQDALRALPWYGGNDQKAGDIRLAWEGDVLSVYMCDAGKNSTEFVLAKFDGTGEMHNPVDGETDADRTYGLDKIAFSGGYKVSFSAKAKDTTPAAPLLIEAINGVAVSEAYKPVTAADFEKAELIGDETVEVNGTRDHKTAAELNLGAKFYYNVSMGSFKANAFETVYADTIDLTKVGDKQYTYSFIGHDVNQTLSVLDGAPVVTLKGGSTAVYRLGGPKASDMAISAADVTAIDELDGELEASAITFTVKVPGSSDFVTLELVGGKFVPDEIGEYVIRYVATDKGGNTAFAELTVKVVDGEIPVITLSGTIPETALIKSSMTLPTATATDKGEPLDGVVRSVFLNDEPVELEGNTLKFTKAGVYKISYYVIDADGNEALKTFTVTVVNDVIKPVLSDVTLPQTAKIGDEIALPSATATDEIDGELNVTIVVQFGTEVVEINDGKLKIEKNGVYTVFYRATDLSGNTAENMYEITVSPVDGNPQDGNTGNGGCGCGSKDAKALAAMISVLGAALFVILKVKK